VDGTDDPVESFTRHGGDWEPPDVVNHRLLRLAFDDRRQTENSSTRSAQ
jgi:hypothetical protein